MVAPVEVVINTDGGARGNPGPAAIGAVITTASGRKLAEVSEAIGPATNNVAEYTAVIRALERAAEIGAKRVTLRSDSLLLVEQLRGVYKVKNPTLVRLHGEVRALARGFDSINFEHVRREQNKKADRLVNVALDAWVSEHGDEIVPAPDAKPTLFD